VLVGYRFDSLDWQFTNISASSTHEFISPKVQYHGPQQVAVSSSTSNPRTFELRVTNWAYGVQIESIHISRKGTLSTIPSYARTIEIIGDSLSAGEYATYEGLSSWSWALCAGLGTEFTISAYPGNCLTDTECWGNAHGQSYQWFRTQDTSWRATQLYGEKPEAWDFAAHPAADIVLVHLGTNDNSTHNNITNERFYTSYVDFVAKIHDTWPKAQIILISLNNGFWLDDRGHWRQNGAFVDEIQRVYNVYKARGWIHYFDTTGLLAHNDIGPQWHYTDVGNVKLASHLMQYIRIKFGWEIEVAGPEVLHGK
jgi:lysophospholipase L1-like esterase